jgi:hypothetical protein
MTSQQNIGGLLEEVSLPCPRSRGRGEGNEPRCCKREWEREMMAEAATKSDLFCIRGWPGEGKKANPAEACPGDCL